MLRIRRVFMVRRAIILALPIVIEKRIIPGFIFNTAAGLYLQSRRNVS